MGRTTTIEDRDSIRAMEQKLGPLSGDELLRYADELTARDIEVTGVNLLLLKAQHVAEERVLR